MKTLVVILGGGRGTRLFPLTRDRSKPAVPLAGKYRLIDIPLSNAINSGLRHVFVLTQFQSASLNRHVSRAYRFDHFSRGFVEILAAEQTEESSDWYQGTADAVRKQLSHFLSREWDYVMVLSGDHLYRMDYRPFLEAHAESRAELTVGVVPVRREEAPGFGILRLDQGWITEFVEKPDDDAVLDQIGLDPDDARGAGIRDPERRFLASMGIYVFNRDVLISVLRDSNALDFGREVIPEALRSRRVGGYFFQDYWEDIGTIRAFYEANVRMTRPDSAFRLIEPEWPFYTSPRLLPASQIRDCRIQSSIVADGCSLDGGEIESSIIGLRSRIGAGTKIRESVIMGADYYEPDASSGVMPIGIGKECTIERAIVDKNARIGDGCTIRNPDAVVEAQGPGWYIRDGIVIIPKNTALPAGTTI